MKFQNPSFKFFLNGLTHARADKPKAIFFPLFQSEGHKNIKLSFCKSRERGWASENADKNTHSNQEKV